MKKTETLKVRVMVTIVWVVILQAVIIIGMIGITGTMDRLDKSTVQTLVNTTNVNGAAMEEQLIEWAQVERYYNNVDSVISQMAIQQSKSVSQLVEEDSARQEILEKCTEEILSCLREKEVTECFLILGNGNTKESKDAVILRDLDPANDSENNYDILVEAGYSQLLFDSGFTLDSFWSKQLPITEESDFYNKPFQAGNRYKEIEPMDLGYYSSTFRLRENDIQMISYTVPLLDENHNSIGILGVGINIEYFTELLSDRGLGIDREGSYYVGIESEKSIYQTVLTSNKQYNGKFSVGDSVEFQKDKRDNLYAMFQNGEASKMESALYSCRLYNTNTPFEQETWVIGGMAPVDTIHLASQELVVALEIALAVAALICIIGAVIVTNLLNKPIVTLLKGVVETRPGQLELPRTHIREIDKLASEIEKRNQEIYKAGSKVSDIIELAGIELGVLECPDNSEFIFCTKKLIQMMDLSLSSWKDNYIKKSEDGDLREKVFSKIRYEEEEDAYCMFTSYGEERWFSVNEVESTNSILYVFQDITNSIQERKKIKHDRDYDVLTNLYNRRAFARIVTKMIEENGCKNGVLSIWDLDHLKYINDTYGHDMGDKYICLLADVLGKEDKNCISGRMAGDEFMVFFYDDNTDVLFERTRRLHKSFLKEKLRLPDGSSIAVGVSVGMAAHNEDGNEYKQLLQYADFAMYEVKNSSKGNIRAFHMDSYMQNYILVQGIGELNRIFEEESIHYAFQPIVDVNTKSIYAYEALIRPDSEIITNPAELLRLAEKQSKLDHIERLSWFCAIKEYYKLTGTRNSIKLFINSIPNQCLEPEEFKELEDKYGDFLKNLVIEVTENARIDETKEKRKYDWCHERNISMALDDYGSGYSNSDMLISREFGFVKLDMSLIRNIHLYNDTQKLVTGMIEYCHTHGQKVIAEGVEYKEELEQVMKLGVDFVQGFYFAKPSENLYNQDISDKFV